MLATPYLLMGVGRIFAFQNQAFFVIADMKSHTWNGASRLVIMG